MATATGGGPGQGAESATVLLHLRSPVATMPARVAEGPRREKQMNDYGFLNRHFHQGVSGRKFAAKKKPVAVRTEPKEAPLDECLARWQDCEARFVKSCTEARDRSRSRIAALILGLIAADSRKHHRVLGHLRRSLRFRDEGIEETEEREVRIFIEQHLQQEEAAMRGAKAVREVVDRRCGDIERLLVQSLYLDEARHTLLLRALKDQMKLRVRKSS